MIPPRVEYFLTATDRELEAHFQALRKWAPEDARTTGIRPESTVVVFLDARGSARSLCSVCHYLDTQVLEIFSIPSQDRLINLIGDRGN